MAVTSSSYEINGKPVSKEEYEAVMGKFSAKPKTVESKTASDTSHDSGSSGQAVYLKFLKENTIDRADLPTFLWSLYAIEEQGFVGNDISSIKLSNNSIEKVLLASSGRTDEYIISNISIDSKIGTLPGVNTDFTFQIRSPYNSDFIDIGTTEGLQKVKIKLMSEDWSEVFI